MSTFNLNDPVPLCTASDLRPEEKHPRVPVSIQLLRLLQNSVAPVISPAGQLFARVPNRFTSFAVPLRSHFLRSWLNERHTATGAPPPSDQQFRHTLDAFQSRALAGLSSGAPLRIQVRTAWSPFHRQPLPETDKYDRITGYDYLRGELQPSIVFALDAYRGRHVTISPQGWSATPTSTAFHYDPLQLSLPDPASPEDSPHPNAALVALRKLLRLDHPDYDPSWKSLLDWILHAMRPAKNPAFHDYPILNFVGPAASGKTVAAKLLAQLIDPTGVPLHSLPATERRLHALAAAHHLLAFDNPGKINPEKSRHLSRLSSGVGSLYRQFEGMLVRPIVLTTRDRAETRHLASRLVDIDLPPVTSPRSQQEIWEEFEKLRPQILAALFTLLSQNFDAPPTHLPNRKTKWQKIDESIPLLLSRNGGAWSGTVTGLREALRLTVSLKALGQYLKSTSVLHVDSTKNNGTVTVTLTPQ